MTFSVRARKLASGIKLYWREHDLGWFINSSMAFLAAIGVLLAFLCSGLAEDVGLNLAFMAIGVFLTVYFVDAAVKKREEKHWSGVDEVAQRFLRRAATEYSSSITPRFDPGWMDRYMITGFEMRVAPEMAHMKLARDPDWKTYMRNKILPQSRFIGYETFQGDNVAVAESLTAYHSRLVQLWPLMSSRWNPEQIQEVLELLFEIPREIHLLHVHTKPGANTGPASLKSINQRSLRLIELCNAEDDPSTYVLSYDPGFGNSNP